ncbi:MAG: hypothetical protein QXO69_00015 [archaeon]
MTEPKISNLYSEKEAEEMMSRWKALVDRVKWDNSAVLYVEPVRNKMASDLLEYAHSQIPSERIIVHSGNKGIQDEQEIKNLRKKISKQASLFLCGERAESCVETTGTLLRETLKIAPKNTFVMHDLSVTWMGASGKARRVDPIYARDIEKISGKKFADSFIKKFSRLIPKTPSVLNERPDKMRALRKIKKEHKSHIVPMTERECEIMNIRRGFSTLPRQKFAKRK